MNDHHYPRVSFVYPIRRGEPMEFTTDCTSKQPDYKVVPADAIVIERGDLPEVYVTEMGDITTDDGGDVFDISQTVSDHRLTAVRHIAIAEYLAAHPPVDEAQVEAFAADLIDAGLTWSGTPDAEAGRRMIARGWTKPVQP